MKPQHAHLPMYHARRRAEALAEIGAALDEAERLRAEAGHTWATAAEELARRGYVSRSGRPWTGPALYFAARRYRDR